MSFDIQFLTLVDDIKVVSQTEVDGSSPRALRLICDGDVRFTNSVEINGLYAASFVVASDKTILIYPGTSFAQTPVEEMAISVISSRWTSGERVRLKFSPGLTLTKVTGTQKLIQQLVKSLLTEGRSNRFDFTEGGGILGALGLNLDPANKAQIASIMSEGASRVQQQYLAEQSGKKLESSERLLTFRLSQVSFDEDSQQAVATFRVLTYDGNNTTLPLVL
jgi:hypothetical protein